MFKKSHRNEKKVIFDIFSKNNQTFCPENSDLKYSYTTLINGKNQSPVKSSRRVQPSLQSTERWQKLALNSVRLLSEEASITVKKLNSKLTDTAELELTCLVVNWCPTTWQNPICRPPFWISNGHHFQRACAAVFPPCPPTHHFDRREDPGDEVEHGGFQAHQEVFSIHVGCDRSCTYVHYKCSWQWFSYNSTK